MSKKVLHVMFILDETGSMGMIKDDVIGSFNTFIEDLAKEKSVTHKFSLVKFNTSHQELVHNAVSIANVIPLTKDTYKPDDTTPLYDAIAKGINSLGKKKNALFIIQTDGQENASLEYTQRQVFDMITEKTNAGWRFIFMGSNQDAWQTGQGLGIAKADTLSYDPSQSPRAMNLVAKGVATYAQSVSQGNKGSSAGNLLDDNDIRQS